MLCTGTKRAQFFWGLGLVACPCSRKFCVAIADVRKRTFHCAPCDPRVECTRECDLCSTFGFLYYRAQSTVPLFIPQRERACGKALAFIRLSLGQANGRQQLRKPKHTVRLGLSPDFRGCRKSE
jgi:hypothetical protein